MRSGKLRALATTGLKRSPATPELPAVAEALSGFEFQAQLARRAKVIKAAGIKAE